MMTIYESPADDPRYSTRELLVNAPDERRTCEELEYVICRFEEERDTFDRTDEVVKALTYEEVLGALVHSLANLRGDNQ